jgi:hypothetical protein
MSLADGETRLMSSCVDHESELYAGQDYDTHNDGMYWPVLLLDDEDGYDEEVSVQSVFTDLMT